MHLWYDSDEIPPASLWHLLQNCLEVDLDQIFMEISFTTYVNHYMGEDCNAKI